MGLIHRVDGYWSRLGDGRGGHVDRHCILFSLVLMELLRMMGEEIMLMINVRYRARQILLNPKMAAALNYYNHPHNHQQQQQQDQKVAHNNNKINNNNQFQHDTDVSPKNHPHSHQHKPFKSKKDGWEITCSYAMARSCWVRTHHCFMLRMHC